MKKKLLSVLMCTAMMFSLAGCGGEKEEAATSTAPKKQTTTENKTSEESSSSEINTADMEEVTLVYAEVNGPTTIVGQTGQAFKEKVEELSDGKMTIDFQPDGALGSEDDILEGMLAGSGTVDMMRLSAFSLTKYGAEKSSLLSLPYTFVSREHFWNFATSDLASEFLLEPHDIGIGVRGLFYAEEGFRHFFTNKEITGIEGLAGMKIRVSSDPVMMGMVESLGATPVEVSFDELSTAFKEGAVDAAEQPIANYESNNFPEVASTMILDGHTLGAVQVIITDEAWDSLTADQQKVLTLASEYASQYNREISEGAENEVLDRLKTNGVNIVEVTDATPWQEACKALIEENTAANADLYQQILDMQ